MKSILNISTSIYSYLPFSDDRIQFIDVRGWDGQAIKLNREFYIDLIRNQMQIGIGIDEDKKKDLINEIKERTENIDGIYILFGEDVKGIKDGITYIGETGNFKKRIANHFRGIKEDKEKLLDEEDKRNEIADCSEIFYFSQRGKLGGGLGESLRKAIESKVIQEAIKSDRLRVLNEKKIFGGKINLIEKDVLKEFYYNIRTILGHLGVHLLKEKIVIREDDDFRERFSHTYGLLINKPKVERMLNNVVSEWDEIKRAKFPDEIRHLSESPQDLFKKVIEIVQNFKKYMSKKDKLDKINAKKPIKGNGVYLQFIERAIQQRVISREYTNRFIELLFEKSIIDLAKEETVAKIIEEFKTTQKAIEEKTRNSKIDALEKEEKIKNLYEKGAKDLLVKFYNYMDITGIDVKKRRESKLEDENLKLVGFIRLHKLNNIDNL